MGWPFPSHVRLAPRFCSTSAANCQALRPKATADADSVEAFYLRDLSFSLFIITFPYPNKAWVPPCCPDQSSGWPLERLPQTHHLITVCHFTTNTERNRHLKCLTARASLSSKTLLVCFLWALLVFSLLIDSYGVKKCVAGEFCSASVCLRAGGPFSAERGLGWSTFK